MYAKTKLLKTLSRNLRVTFGAWLVAISGSERQLKKTEVLVTFENYRMMAQNGKNQLCPEVRTNLGGVLAVLQSGFH